MSHPFKEGMLVQLRSGGPLMTVEDIRHDFYIATAWFEDATLHRDAFAPEDLYRYEKMAY